MINNNMNFYDIIESFAAKASTAKASTAKAPTTSTAKAPTTSTAKAPITSTAKAPTTSTAKSPTTSTAKSPTTSTAKSPTTSTVSASKSRSISSATSASKPVASSSLMSGVQKLTTVAAGSIVLDSIVDDLIDKEDRIYGCRRSGETIEQLQQLIQPQTVTKAVTPVTPVTNTQGKNICDRVEDKGLEFRKPYLFMLKPPNDIMNINEYNYRLISNIFLNNDNLNKDNKRYLYLFGLFPCKYIPSAYIPLNRKKLLENTKRLDVKSDTISSIFHNEQQFNKHFQNKVKQFMNKNTIYNNLNLSVFGIILIIYWSLVLLFLNYVMLYYLRSSFNNILATILLILLLFSIIWKMIYTVQN
jgi:hypothetical protein